MELYHYIGIVGILGIAYFVIKGRLNYKNNKKKLPNVVYRLISVIYPEGSRRALIVRYVNQQRGIFNLPLLKTDRFLDLMARRRVEEIDKSNILSHYGSADEFMGLREHGSHGSAEVIAGNYGTAKGVVNGWMKSESHHNAIMSMRYDACAIHSKWDVSEKRFIDVMMMIDIDKDLK
jgi:uncharacterized protein YkwD